MATGAASEAERERETERERPLLEKQGAGAPCARARGGLQERANEERTHTMPVLLPPNSQSQAAVEGERDLRSPGGDRRPSPACWSVAVAVGRSMGRRLVLRQSVSRTIAADAPTVGAEEEESEFRLTTKQERARWRPLPGPGLPLPARSRYFRNSLYSSLAIGMGASIEGARVTRVFPSE